MCLLLIDAIERNGVLPPWAFIQHLIALTTDTAWSAPSQLRLSTSNGALHRIGAAVQPIGGVCALYHSSSARCCRHNPDSAHRDNAKAALCVLKRIGAKHPEMLHRHLADGLEEAAKFQARLTAAMPAAAVAAAADKAVRGVSSIYAEILQSTQQGRNAALAAVVRRFEAACDLSSPSAGNLSLLHMCAKIAAGLPLKRGDEAMMLVHPIHKIISQHGEGILAALKAVVKDVQPAQQASRATSGHAQQQICRASAGVTVLLLLSNCLEQKYSLTADRLAAFQPTSEKRKAEGRVVLQPQPAELPVDQLSVSAADSPKELAGQYTGLKALLQNFHASHQYLFPGRLHSPGQAGMPVDQGVGLSPQAAETPTWAQQTGQTLQKANSRKSGGREALSLGKGQSTRQNWKLSRGAQGGKSHRKRARRSMQESQSDGEDDFDTDYENPPNKVSRPRKNVDAMLAND